MSVLDRGNAEILVYPQTAGTDSDGNPTWTPSPVGVPLTVMAWPIDSTEASGLSRQSGEAYRMRPARGQAVPVGPWATVEWDGRLWDVHGDSVRHQRGSGTRRTTFVVVSRTKRPGDGGVDDG